MGSGTGGASAGSGSLGQLQRDFAMLTGSVPPATRAVESFGRTSQQAAQHTATLASRIVAIGQGLLIYKGFTLIESSISRLAQGILQLPAAFEQAEIGFTSMLDGNRAAADQMLAQIQQLANVTPFRFTQEQQAARILLGLGQAAEKVLPELVDIDTAVAAVGGGEEQVQRVAAALGKMSAEGRVSAIFMNELTRDGIPAWRMLAESMNLPVEKIRQMSENGEIAASTFEKAFHEYTVRHFGDALAAQSQTFSGLISTAQDLGEQFLRVFGMPIIQELEPKLRGALQALQDPRVLQTIEQWGQGAATFVGWIFEAVGGVAQLLGLPVPDLSKNMADASDAVKQFAGDWSSVGSDGGPIASTKAHVAQINRDIRQAEIALRTANRAADATELTYKHQSDALSEQIRLLQARYDLENHTADRAELVAKINKDAALAVDVYSSQGQAAAKRLVDERAQLRQMDRQAAFEAQKGALEDQKRGIDAEAQTFREGQAARQRDAQAHIDDLRQQALDAQDAGNTGTPGAPPSDPGIKAASDQYRAAYDSSVRASISAATLQYQQFYGTTIPDVIAQAQHTIWEKLFGTTDQQQQKGQEVGAALMTGLGTAIHDWSQGQGTPLMNALMGGSNFTDALNNWGAQAGGLEDAGIAFAKAMFPDWPGLGAWLTGKGHESDPPPDDFLGRTGAAFGKANRQIGEVATGIGDAITAPFRQAEATTARQRSKPDHYPMGHDPAGRWVAGRSYQDGTTDWVWQDAASAPYRQTYGGGRAGGGSVIPHHAYQIGEGGPEMLYMGEHGGYIVPQTYATLSNRGDSHLTITVRTERGEVLGIVQTAIQQQVSGKFMATRLGQYASR